MAQLMEQVTTEVRALLQELQDARKARLDPGRRDVQFVPGDLVLLDVDSIPSSNGACSRPVGRDPFRSWFRLLRTHTSLPCQRRGRW